MFSFEKQGIRKISRTDKKFGMSKLIKSEKKA